jgi:L-Ala-D/L-Glu epimerase
MIIEVAIELKELLLKKPFVTTGGAKTSIHQVFLSVNWKGYVGVGSSLLPPFSLTMKNQLLSIITEWNNLIKNRSPFEREFIIKDLIKEGGTAFPFLITSLDIALFDLLGKSVNLPVYKLLGLKGDNNPVSSMSIGSLREEELIKEIKLLKEYPILKLKIASFNELNNLQKVRTEYNGRIWVDGNCSLHPEELEDAIHILEENKVELIEQPIPPGNYKELKKIKGSSLVKVVADEDCAKPQDLFLLSECVDVVNIKIHKTSGFSESLLMARLAKKIGFEVMLGCKTESVLGVTAIAHLSGLADYVDFDGHVDLEDDPYKGIKLAKGNYTLSSKPGFGTEKNIFK